MSKLGDCATKAIIKEVNQMLEKSVFNPVYMRDILRDQISSPTVATAFMIAIIAAGEWREIATVDMPGAYLHTDLPSDCVNRMGLNKYLSNLMMQVDCDYANYMT